MTEYKKVGKVNTNLEIRANIAEMTYIDKGIGIGIDIFHTCTMSVISRK